MIAFVTSSTDPGRSQPTEISFGDNKQAKLVNDPGQSPAELLSRLGLQPTHNDGRVILACGGADNLEGQPLARAQAVLGDAVVAAAKLTRAAVLDGGTSSGVMKIIGAARARDPKAMPVQIGVAPASQVCYPGSKPGDGRVPLDENHSHFILAPGSEWGSETGLLIGLADAFAVHGRCVVVLAGGGKVARSEILESVRRGWPVFVIGGTAGVADEILELWKACRLTRRRTAGWPWPKKFRYRPRRPTSSIEDLALREIVTNGDIRSFTGSEPGQLARQIAWELQDEPVLKSAWQQFATYDQLATRLRAAFTRFQAAILLLGVLSTLLALIQAHVANTVLHWVVVTIPILAAVLVAVAGRRAVGQRWVMLRAAAEAIKAEIYRYRTLTGGGRPVSSADHGKYQRDLAGRLGHIESRLMQTDASSGPLSPYRGPLPPEMYGAGRNDDGVSPLDAHRYLDIRISDQLAYYHGRIRSLSVRRNVLQFVSIAAGASGAILAAAGFYVWIGLTGGVAAALLAYLNSLQIDNTIVGYNQSATKLAGMERDWQALGEARLESAEFEKLVNRTETVLTSELAGWVQQMSETVEEIKKKHAADQADLTRGAKAPESSSATAHHGH
jgi:hypothetical protein